MFCRMKNKVPVIVLLLVCVGLMIALLSLKQQTAAEHKSDVDIIVTSSNQLVESSSRLDEQKQVNLKYEKDLADRKTDLAKLSNDLTQTSESLTKTESNLSKSEAALKAALEETAKRDARITELESQKDSLDKQALTLKDSISNLEGQITDTKNKLAASEGDKAYLTKELNRLMAEKKDLEDKFNNLAVLRERVHQLNDEMVVARRLAWLHDGVLANSELKGAQKLVQGANALYVAKADNSKYDLNVEVSADGSVKVIAPITNSSPASP